MAIIGAGLAGLRCADILLSHGFKVTVIEGRDRVGGRLHQQKLPNGRLVDMGPNWIHGTKDNPMLDLAKQTGTMVGSWDNGSYAFDEFGDVLEEGEQLSDTMWEIVQDAFKHSNKLSGEIHDKESLHDFFQEKVIEKIPETDEGYEKKRRTVLHMSDLWGAFVGSPTTRQSLKFFWLEECLEGENLFCAGTYEKILDKIAKPALAKADIKFKKRAEGISYRSDPLDHVKINLSDGSVLEVDEVVVTSPLGWLKKNLSAFEPPLPIRLTKAIESIGYGCLEKVYITFPKAFWLATGDDEKHKVKGFVQWLSPNYAPDSNPKKWAQEVVELASLNPETSHPTLLFYIYGEQSEYLTGKVGELSSEKDREKFLFAFFKPYYSRLPHYSDSSPDCQPTGCLTTDWLHDDLAGNGSYSNFQVGLEDGDGDIKAMRQGLPEMGLWFAGEHTAPFVALGTATGAYWSGESVGRRIAEGYGMARNESSTVSTGP